MLSVKRIGGGAGAAGAAAMADYYEGEVRRDLADRLEEEGYDRFLQAAV